MNKSHSIRALLYAFLCVGMLTSCEKQEISDNPIALYTGAAYHQVMQDQLTDETIDERFFELNIIGVPKDGSAMITGIEGERIFISTEEKSGLLLSKGNSYNVADGNGLNGTASFQLPSLPGKLYSIFVVPFTKDNDSTKSNMWHKDASTQEDIYSIGVALEINQHTGADMIDLTHETLELSGMIYDTNEDGIIDTSDELTYSIFHEAWENKIWTYNENGLKVLKLRFYQI